MRCLFLSLFASFSLAALTLCTAGSPPPASVPSDGPVLEARGHGGRGGIRVLKRLRERRQERRGAGACA